ncbi:unnamed protein product [Dibothriocephalus latus]|uniref:Sm domain-containing protein n=1 Tax=Dibothriocephalus latus TaxID=60516 RepID=A0A3P7MEE9_DIBLA|nr:unnamed protein product [Dibothriocephalus latus]
MGAKKRLSSSLLAIFPAAMTGKRVSVTLLDDTLITGRLASMDGFLNLELDSGVEVVSPLDSVDPLHLDTIQISGKRVRYIGLPSTLDVHGKLRKYLQATGQPAFSQRKYKKDKYAHLRNQQLPGMSGLSHDACEDKENAIASDWHSI